MLRWPAVCIYLLLLVQVTSAVETLYFEQERFTILQLTDTHLGSIFDPYFSSRSTYDQIEWLADEYNAGLIVVSGDIVVSGSSPRAVKQIHNSLCKYVTQDLGLPYMVTF
ncbi:hypothetical protein KIPB_011903, partial [Kipferlia bialata]|eukprot:g11903.t1